MYFLTRWPSFLLLSSYKLAKLGIAIHACMPWSIYYISGPLGVWGSRTRLGPSLGDTQIARLNGGEGFLNIEQKQHWLKLAIWALEARGGAYFQLKGLKGAFLSNPFCFCQCSNHVEPYYCSFLTEVKQHRGCFDRICRKGNFVFQASLN